VCVCVCVCVGGVHFWVLWGSFLWNAKSTYTQIFEEVFKYLESSSNNIRGLNFN
jgi:hypothetical protein